MKRFGSILFFVLLCSSTLLAQLELNLQGTVTGILERTDTANVKTYEGFNPTHIGRQAMTGQYKEFKYRSFGVFGPASGWPPDGAVDNVSFKLPLLKTSPTTLRKSSSSQALLRPIHTFQAAHGR